VLPKEAQWFTPGFMSFATLNLVDSGHMGGR